MPSLTATSTDSKNFLLGCEVMSLSASSVLREISGSNFSFDFLNLVSFF